jgi:DNA-binding XRE family transcriptional regulator
VTLVHRHLAIDPGTPPDNLPLDALDDLLERGDLDDWRALASVVRDDPHGALADRVLALCRAHPMYGTSRLWPAFIARLRADTQHTRPASSLAAIRKGRGLSQADVALRLGISQSDVSKLERRPDPRISTLRRYLAAIGGDLRLAVEFDDGTVSTIEPVSRPS